MLNETHDPALRSWVPSTAADAADFPIQNLPFGRFVSPATGRPTLGVAIADAVLDLVAATAAGVLGGDAAEGVNACRDGWLNGLMALPARHASALRRDLSRALRADACIDKRLRACLFLRRGLRMLRPVDVRNFSDFYTSIHHARNCGRLRRPDNPVLPSFHAHPVAYHGRASTLSASGTAFHRPMGQFVRPGESMPVFEASQALDFECELGVYVGQGSALGERIALQDAPRHVFGFSLLNDWSARDLQVWESSPLGPFLSKSFVSTVGEWVVTAEAMAPFHVPAAPREEGVAPLLPCLDEAADRLQGGLSIDLEIRLRTAAMQRAGSAAMVLARPRFSDQYWTVGQMLAHQASNGCRLETGDLLGSGTVSGPTDDRLGCLLELTRAGQRSFMLPDGEERTYLEDGDEVVIAARSAAPGFVPIGFGACAGTVLPARR
jgi:fumarylacetoacetase